MKAEIKTQWLEALRSGKYQQGRHQLRSKDGTYCCLGVLCDVVDPSLWSKAHFLSWEHDTFPGRPSNAVHERTELTYPQASTLINLNDLKKLSFSEIADYIEKEL